MSNKNNNTYKKLPTFLFQRNSQYYRIRTILKRKYYFENKNIF